MNAHFDAFLKDSTARNEAAKRDGQKIICHRWPMLAPETRAALFASGFYSERGQRLETENSGSDFPQHDAEQLERALGLFKHCLAATLPLPAEQGRLIPIEAITEEVLSAAAELLNVRDWQDPEFLRLALGAIARQQQSDALSVHKPLSKFSPAWGCLAAFAKLVLFLAMPVTLASGLAAAFRQDVGDAALAFYVVGFAILAAMSALGVGVKKTDGHDLAYARWTRFQVEGAVGVTGAAALERLRQMAGEGINVPAVAFDAATLLGARTVGQQYSEAIKANVAKA
jgi:hypothetical protein